MRIPSKRDCYFRLCCCRRRRCCLHRRCCGGESATRIEIGEIRISEATDASTEAEAARKRLRLCRFHLCLHRVHLRHRSTRIDARMREDDEDEDEERMRFCRRRREIGADEARRKRKRRRLTPLESDEAKGSLQSKKNPSKKAQKSFPK